MMLLTKECIGNSDALRNYFTAIHELSKQNDKFPINLDDVWQLCYKERGKAIRTLRSNFIEGEDYTTFAQNGKTATGGYTKTIFKLSVKCLEYFIVRKIRAVFDVYRQIFHNVADKIQQGELIEAPSTPSTPAQLLLQQAQFLVDMEHRQQLQEQRTLAIENKLQQMEKEKKEATDNLLLFPLPERIDMPEFKLRDKLRKMVNDYSTATNISQQDIWHKVYADLYYRFHIAIKQRRLPSDKSLLDTAQRIGILDKMDVILSSMIYEIRHNT